MIAQPNQISENVSSTVTPRDGGSKLLSDSLVEYSTSDEIFHQNNVDNEDNSLKVSFVILACFINGIIVAIIYICYHYKLSNIIRKTNQIQSEE